jgi:RNA polymerase sigma factor (sigma-70 family)
MRKVLGDIRKVALLEGGAGLTDGQLLACFIERRDNAAFAALLKRHGPMVWGVCRRLLSFHDAEDAFQATFLVLCRKAASIVPREMVANWLHGVAHHAALHSRRTTARRRARDRQVAEMPEPAVTEHDAWRDLRPALDQELSRLPDRHRVVIVLCDLEGKTRKEAARQLGCPEGTVAGRLARARVTLARRLARRGLALSGGALAALLCEQSACAAVPPSVVSSTLKAASLFAAGQAAAPGAISVQVAALTEGVLKAMLLTKLKMAMAVLLCAAALVVGSLALVSPGSATGQTGAGETGKAEGAARGAPESGQTDAAKPATAAAGANKAQAAMSWKERLAVDAPDDVGQTFNVAVAPDGKKIAVGYARETRILDAKNGQELVTLTEAKGYPAMAFSPDGKDIAVSGEGDVLLYSADSGQIKAKLECTKHVFALAISPDGKTLAAASGGPDGGELRLWDLATNKLLRELDKWEAREGKEPGAWSIAFSSDSKKLATAQGSDRTAKVWDVETGKELATFGEHPGWVVAVAFSPDGKTVAAGSPGKQSQVVKLWDLATGKERATLEGPVGAYNSLAFSPDGSILAVAGPGGGNSEKADSMVRLWDPATGKQITALDAHTSVWAISLGFSRDGRTLVTSGDDAVRIWEPESGPAPNKK